MVVLAIVRFLGPSDEDDNGVVLSRFLKCDDGTDLSDKIFAGHAGAMLTQQARDAREITDEHRCVYLGLREVPHSEVVQLYEDTRA